MRIVYVLQYNPSRVICPSYKKIMGCACSRINLSGVLDLPVAAAELEAVARDVESRPQFLPCILELHVVRGGTRWDLQAGTQWRETVRFRNQVWTLYKTVTKLETDPYFAVTVCNDFREVRHREHSMETISCVIEPIDSQSCRVIWTLALMAVGVHHKIRTALCYCRLANALEKHAQAYMKCFSDEAVRRRAKEIPE